MSGSSLLEDRLSTYFPGSPSRGPYNDDEVDSIAQLLEKLEHVARKSPRLYIVLRTIDRLSILGSLLDSEFDDRWFPVTAIGLPAFLGPEDRNSIVAHQHLIMTQALNLEIRVHCRIDNDLPFDLLGVLGIGGYGQVSRIQSRISAKQFALKTIRRQVAFKASQIAMKEFFREIEIIKTLRHRHIIEYIGSYTTRANLGLIMSPIAEYDLARFLEMHRTTTEHRETLRTFFGCLANALFYLHSCRIKHRDIKPQNILVHKFSVLLTDFGLSHQSLEITSGPTALTHRYSPPEVVSYARRNESADIWSLGCVYLEMIAALRGYNLAWLKHYYERCGTKAESYHANAEATRILLQEMSELEPIQDAQPLAWVTSMMVSERDDRPSAAQIAENITASDHMTSVMYCCVWFYDFGASESGAGWAEDGVSTYAATEEPTLKKSNITVPALEAEVEVASKSDVHSQMPREEDLVETLDIVAIEFRAPKPSGDLEDVVECLSVRHTFTDEELATTEDEDAWDLIYDDEYHSHHRRGGRGPTYPEHLHNVSREQPHRNPRTNTQHSKRRTSRPVVDEDLEQDKRPGARYAESDRLTVEETEMVLGEAEPRPQRRREQRRVKMLAEEDAAADLQEEEVAAYKRHAVRQRKLEARLQDEARALRHQERRERHVAALAEKETPRAERQRAEPQSILEGFNPTIRHERPRQGREFDGQRSDEASAAASSILSSHQQRSRAGPKLMFPIAKSKKSNGFLSWLHSLG